MTRSNTDGASFRLSLILGGVWKGWGQIGTGGIRTEEDRERILRQTAGFWGSLRDKNQSAMETPRNV